MVTLIISSVLCSDFVFVFVFCFFFNKFFVRHMSIFGATDTPVSDWWRLLWVSPQSLYHALHKTKFLRFQRSLSLRHCNHFCVSNAQKALVFSTRGGEFPWAVQWLDVYDFRIRFIVKQMAHDGTLINPFQSRSIENAETHLGLCFYLKYDASECTLFLLLITPCSQLMAWKINIWVFPILNLKLN